jgi:xanthosine utilization system XapX-like protein
MELMLKILTVFGIGIIELLAPIPTGFALGLHPSCVGVASICGALVGVVGIVLLGEKVRSWILRLHGKRSEDIAEGKKGLIYRIWAHYGVIGLGLLAPLIIGVPLGVTLGIAFGAPYKTLMFRSNFGAILWGVGITLGIALGISGIEDLVER